MAARKKKTGNDAVVITSPDMRVVRVPIRGDSNYVSNAFSQEAQLMMEAKQEQGEVDKKRKNKPPKDFEKEFRGSLHQSIDGWYGIPVIAFRASMVRAAQLCGIEMTRAKMCVFVECDGFTSTGQGLVRITKGEPEEFRAHVRNATGVADIRARGRWAPGWEATITLKYDAEFLSAGSVINLLARAGVSVGIGSGRPFSSMSVGQGWGTFEIITDQRPPIDEEEEETDSEEQGEVAA